MLRQYQQIKREYKDAILMFRLGDFYEMFGEDAKKASKILDIVLTARNKRSEVAIPMCGVPYHAIDSYIIKLIKAGEKVAICDQMEDPSSTKGIVRREVTRLITPGTFDDSNYLSAGQNNFLLSIYPKSSGFGLSWCDITTGELLVSEIEGDSSPALSKLQNEIARLQPAEII
jgi:DNA mismatch repair protein MutS